MNAYRADDRVLLLAIPAERELAALARILIRGSVVALGTAEEVAEGVVWLLSEGASYVTGSILEIGGGR